jgi:cytochrome P450
MVLYPDVLSKAQAELDSFTSGSAINMPTFKDMDNLPYCSALVKEVLRWAPSVPGGFPHYSDADDEYLGYKVRNSSLSRRTRLT